MMKMMNMNNLSSSTNKIKKPIMWDIYYAKVFYEDSISFKKRYMLLVDNINEIYLNLKITGNTKRNDITEYNIIKWKDAGLKKPSHIRIHKFYPITENNLIEFKGVLQKEDRESLINQIEKFLKLYNTRYTTKLVKKIKEKY